MGQHVDLDASHVVQLDCPCRAGHDGEHPDRRQPHHELGDPGQRSADDVQLLQQALLVTYRDQGDTQRDGEQDDRRDGRIGQSVERIVRQVKIDDIERLGGLDERRL